MSNSEIINVLESYGNTRLRMECPFLTFVGVSSSGSAYWVSMTTGGVSVAVLTAEDGDDTGVLMRVSDNMSI